MWSTQSLSTWSSKFSSCSAQPSKFWNRSPCYSFNKSSTSGSNSWKTTVLKSSLRWVSLTLNGKLKGPTGSVRKDSRPIWKKFWRMYGTRPRSYRNGTRTWSKDKCSSSSRLISNAWVKKASFRRILMIISSVGWTTPKPRLSLLRSKRKKFRLLRRCLKLKAPRQRGNSPCQLCSNLCSQGRINHKLSRNLKMYHLSSMTPISKCLNKAILSVWWRSMRSSMNRASLSSWGTTTETSFSTLFSTLGCSWRRALRCAWSRRFPSRFHLMMKSPRTSSTTWKSW